MIKTKTLCLTSLMSLFFAMNTIVAQQKEAVADSIDKEINELIESSSEYNGYKNIRQYKIDNLQKSIKEQVNELDARIEALNEKNAEKQEQIERFKKDLDERNKEIEEIEKSKSEISFLGMNTLKSTYKTAVGIIIGVLVLFLLVFFSRYRSSQKTTKVSRKNLRSLEEEYEAYRKKALESQQKLGRELQDVRNRGDKQ